MPSREEQSLLAGRRTTELDEREVSSVANTIIGLDGQVPFVHDPAGKTRFAATVENGEEVGRIYFGADIYPGPGVVDPNSALPMKAAVAHEISHFHRWRDRTELLPIDVYWHLDEALTSLDAVLRFPTLSPHEIQTLVRDAVQRLQMYYAGIADQEDADAEPPSV